MNKIELFNFIEDNAVFKGIGTFFVLVDEGFRIHNINYDAVNPGTHICIGDFLKCSNALSAQDGCGCHMNCKQCNLRLMVEASMKKMERMECDASFLLNHNQDFSVHAISHPLIDNGKKYSIVLFMDRTSSQREIMLERIFCHDLLNLSGALYGLIENMDNNDSAEMRSALKSISTQMMEEIKAQRDLIYAINGLLKPDNSVFKASDIVDFVKDSLVPVAADMYSKKVVIESNLSDENLLSDKTLINRVIHNMLKNACEAQGGDTVIFKAWSEDGKVKYCVHNDAVMSPEVKSKIFIQGNSTKKSGRGLGTYSMKLIGENYLGGKVYFRSEEGFGTEFCIEL